MKIDDKYSALKERLKSFGSVAVAFSSGVDSTFLLKAAKDALGENTAAITARSPLIPENELDEAIQFCRQENILHIICDIDPFTINGFTDNSPNRCYVCKKEIFRAINELAAAKGINAVVEGSNIDDNNDYRPGMRAIQELGIESPLQFAGFTKQEIREMSAKLNLPTWNKPSFACLASRFAYGEKITKEKLKRVEKAEKMLLEKDFKQFRVRVHSDIARIEILPEDFHKLLDMRMEIYERFKNIGFSYITMDLQGYRTGSMNEVLND